MPFFSKVFKHRDAAAAIAKKHAMLAESTPVPAYRPRYISTWESTEVVIDEVAELVHACTAEMKSRAQALDTPFLLLPFRPDSDATSARSFINAYFKSHRDGSMAYRGEALEKELRLTGTDHLCCIIKWIWSRIPQGVVSWNVYASFRDGEKESGMVIDSFDAFIPLFVDIKSRKDVIYDFFDLLSVIAAHGKVNGMGGRQLSRMAGWWAFEQTDAGKGFVGGYKSWTDAADAASHLFFAYLRSRAPEAVNGISGISNLPRSLQALVSQTEYPPQRPAAMQSSTAKVLMIVSDVSPTPFALLRRARLFDYRADDKALNKFSEYADPVDALTVECKRVLEAIASANQSSTTRARRNFSNTRVGSKISLTAGEDPWSRFQDEGFDSSPVDSAAQSPQAKSPVIARYDHPGFSPSRMQGSPMSRPRVGRRPTTPSWADFLNSGFVETDNSVATNGHFLPPDQHLPPVLDHDFTNGSLAEDDLEPGELASINRFELDESFWWVWMTSLAAEETSVRKAAFGRCALVETSIPGGRWLLLEEQVKGASEEQSHGVYVAEKRSRSLFTRRNKSTKRKNSKKGDSPQTPKLGITQEPLGSAKANLSPEQRARISAAAAVVAKRKASGETVVSRRGRLDDDASIKTNSIMTTGLSIDASPALKWANAYDKEAVRREYLGNEYAGKGLSVGAPMSRTTSAADEQAQQDPFIKKWHDEVAATNSSDAHTGVSSQTPSSTQRSISPRPRSSASRSNYGAKVSAADGQPRTPAMISSPESVSSPTAFSSGESPSHAKRNSISRKPVSPEPERHIHPAFRSSLVDLHQDVNSASIVPEPQNGTNVASSRPEVRDVISPTALDNGQKPRTGVMDAKKLVVRRKQAPPASPQMAKDDGYALPSQASQTAAGPKVVNVQPRRADRKGVRDIIKNLETAHTPSPEPARSASSTPSPARLAQPQVSRDRPRFDEGPLDMPAFVPRASLDSDDGSPAPARARKPVARAGMREDPDTSEEETMEERVARIKARVTALTGIDHAQRA